MRSTSLAARCCWPSQTPWSPEPPRSSAPLWGVAAGGLVDTMLESRRERARAKAGARLVAHDLDTAATVLKSLEDDAMWFPFQQIEMVAWPEYRDVLALRLTNDQFDSVSGTVTGIVYFMQGGQAMHERKLGQPSLLSPAAVKQAHRARADMTEAYNALAKLAGHEPVVSLARRANNGGTADGAAK